ncbi:MAG: nitrite reductase large subunit NirB [Phycisphaerae bacterium]|nr:nitrite reductase large subunit NirB [Tepidisphaeraceae bacterium]
MLMENRERLVVIGNGMAGARVVEEILARAPRMFHVTMIGAEPHGNYNRILLSNVLNGSQDASEIIMNPLEWYARNHIELLAGVRAFTIDRTRRLVLLADGRTVEYDRLIIATGSRPFVPPIPGTDLAGVFVFRTIDDCEQIARYAKGVKTAAVIGGGLLGLEAARGLMTHGPAVHVIEMAPHLMAVQLDSAGGAVLGKAINDLGVTAHCGAATATILGDDDGKVRGLRFKDGGELACDMVVISAGIRANIEVAKDSAMNCERGILVDDQMRTPYDDIYAVGECAQHRGVVYGLVAPIWEQCAVLADVITGTNPASAYHGSLLATKLKVMGVNVASMGERDEKPGDEAVKYEDVAGGVYKKLIVREGRLVGAILVGEIDAYGDLVKKLTTGAALPARRSELLFGAPAGAAGVSVADLPDDHQVCDCNGVSKGAIVKVVQEGKCTVAAVGACTRAGTGCGSCKKMVKDLIEAVAGEVKADPSEAWYVPAVPMEKPALVEEIRKRGLKSVSAVLAELGTGQDPKSKNGLASLLKSMWNDEYVDERDARFINDRVHANIQKDGTFSVVPRIYGGITSADELIRFGEVAKKYNVPMVKITGGQRIDLLGVKKEDLPGMWRDLGIPSGYAYTKAFRTCKTCVGTEFCRYGTNDSTGLGVDIERRFQGIEFPAKLKMAVSGCPRNCAESTVKDIGIIASEGGDWDILVGGAAGASVRKADLLCRVKTKAEAMVMTARFMQYYREHGKWLERTYDFVPRVGLDRLKELLVDDKDGICAGLEERLQESIDTWEDPWAADTRANAYAGQFERTRAVALPVLNG